MDLGKGGGLEKQLTPKDNVGDPGENEKRRTTTSGDKDLDRSRKFGMLIAEGSRHGNIIGVVIVFTVKGTVKYQTFRESVYTRLNSIRTQNCHYHEKSRTENGFIRSIVLEQDDPLRW